MLANARGSARAHARISANASSAGALDGFGVVCDTTMPRRVQAAMSSVVVRWPVIATSFNRGNRSMSRAGMAVRSRIGTTTSYGASACATSSSSRQGRVNTAMSASASTARQSAAERATCW